MSYDYVSRENSLDYDRENKVQYPSLTHQKHENLASHCRIFFPICTVLFYVKSFHLRKIIPISFGILHFTTFYYASDTYEALLRTCCYFREKMCQLLAMDHCEYFYLKKREKWTIHLFRFCDQSIHKIYFLIRCCLVVF